MISSASILSVEQDKSKAIIYCQTDNRKSYLCLVTKHELNQAPYWCFYIGLTREEYVRLYQTIEVRMDHFSFIGIAGDTVSVQAKIADTVMMDQPEYFIGTHVWGADMKDSTGVGIMQQLMELCTEVDSIITREEQKTS